MKLRKLLSGDAPLMLEWMHDSDVVRDLKTDFSSKTIDDCAAFIESAQDTSENLHLAIADDNGEYMGTASLKHICNGTAEFGITIRKCAMGKGFSSFGMREIINTGFADYNLRMIYWCVDPVNHRAVRFYDKNGYKKCPPPSEASGYSDEEISRFYWYAVQKEAQ